MIITSDKTYEPGEKIICIISSNSYLVRGKTYTVKSAKNSHIYLEENPGYQFNVARFVSVKEIRESKLKNILNDGEI